MSRPVVLCVNLPADKLRRVRLACMRLSLLVQEVGKEDIMHQPLGALCGLMPRLPEKTAADLDGEMLIMANLNRTQAERLLSALKQAKVHLPLKAVLTPVNAGWDCVKLHAELTAERDAIQGGQKADHANEQGTNTVLTRKVYPGEHALQHAIDQLPGDGTPALLHLMPGEYREKVELKRPNTILEGEDAASTVIVWADGATDPMPDGLSRGTFRSYTMLVDADHVTLRCLTVRNEAAPRDKVGQAVALYADGDHFLCEDCILRSFQDTLFTAPLPPKEIQKNGFLGPKQFAPRKPQRHTYRRCRIEGDVDFIFGGAAAWFEDCDIVSVDGWSKDEPHEGGYATAASTPEGQKYGYVFHHCRFLGEGVKDGSIYLGRPWREWAKTVLIDCEIGAHIRPEGWHDWDKHLFHEVGYYAEYGCTGKGSEGTRADFVRTMSADEAAAVTYEDFMASL